MTDTFRIFLASPGDVSFLREQTEKTVAEVNGTFKRHSCRFETFLWEYDVPPQRSQVVQQAIDAAAGTVTIDHGPIPEANWPAMTMGFRASADIAKQVRVGDKVDFDLKVKDGAGEITALRPHWRRTSSQPRSAAWMAASRSTLKLPL